MCKFKDILRTSPRQHTTIGFNTHCNKTQKCTLLHFVDRIDIYGSQGQGRQSLGQTVLSSNFFACIPQQYTGLLVLKSFCRRSSWLLICTALHGHFSKCTLCFHQLGLYLFFGC